jgi:hypothetical protein
MTSNYHLDLSQISLAAFKQTLKEKVVLPGRKILKEDLDARFKVLEEQGIEDLSQLLNALKTKRKVERFAFATGLPLEYVTILGRQVRSYLPKPVYLKDIPGVDAEVVDRLAGAGIRQTKQLFEQGWNATDRFDLALKTGVSEEVLWELVQMSDLARAGWVGPIFVRIIFETGTQTLADLAFSDPQKLYEKMLDVNRKKQFTKAVFTLKDVIACVEMAVALPKILS